MNKKASDVCHSIGRSVDGTEPTDWKRKWESLGLWNSRAEDPSPAEGEVVSTPYSLL